MTPAELAALHAACFTTPRPWSEGEFADLLNSKGCFLLAERGGFLLGRVIVDEAELLTIAVAPDLRRSGLGRKLTEAFVATARAKGAESAFLEVAEGNAAARALYAAAGFGLAGMRRNYYHRPDGTGEDAFILVRSLIEPR